MRSDNPFELCLGDFGASIDVSEQKDFQAHLFIGTPGYFPPEMKVQSILKNYSFPIDLYSTAIVAFRSCTFLHPRAEGPIVNCYSKELTMIIHQSR